MKRVKIIATLGPASASTEVLRAMVLHGVNVFRLNMSHSELESHREKILQIRELSKALDCPLGILADLQGPKIRTGYLENHKPVALVVHSLL
ncbi:MAG: hypothetical protein K2X66_17965 [Cyanobacteria bacterium]|nr:hypothetical protein [Cyanobacteriota bacterium]